MCNRVCLSAGPTYRFNIQMVCEMIHVVLQLCLCSQDSGAEVRFFCGTQALQVLVFWSLESFLLDVEWTFNDFSFLTFTCIPFFQHTDECSSLLSIFTMCFTHELNFLIRFWELQRHLESSWLTCTAPDHTFSLRNSQAFNSRLWSL